MYKTFYAYILSPWYIPINVEDSSSSTPTLVYQDDKYTCLSTSPSFVPLHVRYDAIVTACSPELNCRLIPHVNFVINLLICRVLDVRVPDNVVLSNRQSVFRVLFINLRIANASVLLSLCSVLHVT